MTFLPILQIETCTLKFEIFAGQNQRTVQHLTLSLPLKDDSHCDQLLKTISIFGKQLTSLRLNLLLDMERSTPPDLKIPNSFLTSPSLPLVFGQIVTLELFPDVVDSTGIIVPKLTPMFPNLMKLIYYADGMSATEFLFIAQPSPFPNLVSLQYYNNSDQWLVDVTLRNFKTRNITSFSFYVSYSTIKLFQLLAPTLEQVYIMSRYPSGGKLEKGVIYHWRILSTYKYMH